MKHSNIVVAVVVVILVIAGAAVWSRSVSQPMPQPPSQADLVPPPPPPAGAPELISASGSTLTPATSAKKIAGTGSGSNASPTPQPSKVVLITYANSGFSPSLAEVKLGQVVRFQNASTRPLWVQTTNGADAAHESAFNTGDSIVPGGHWDYVFTHQGTWSYENVDYPQHKGAVAVEPQNY